KATAAPSWTSAVVRHVRGVRGKRLARARAGGLRAAHRSHQGRLLISARPQPSWSGVPWVRTYASADSTRPSSVQKPRTAGQSGIRRSRFSTAMSQSDITSFVGRIAAVYERLLLAEGGAAVGRNLPGEPEVAGRDGEGHAQEGAS